MMDRIYIQVILPLKLDWLPWYSTEEQDVCEGMRVSVKFASRRYVGVIARVCDVPDIDESRVLQAERIERGLDCIIPKEMELWRFIADYYMCTVGEVYKSAYPMMRIEKEEAAARATARRETALARERERLDARLARLRTRLLRKEEELSGRHSEQVQSRLEVDRDNILKDIELVVEEIRRIESKSAASDVVTAQKIVEQSGSSFDSSSTKPVLLRLPSDERIGAYESLVKETISKGRNVLILAPEIFVAEQIVGTICSNTLDCLPDGSRPAMLYHSALTPVRRREAAEAVRSGGTLVVGTRSAVMLPFVNLGLVIVEDEHSAAYKQDVTPRYNARDLAVVLAGMHHCGVILGSETPSLESILNLQIGRYDEMSGHTVASEAVIPEISVEIVDTKAERRKNGMVGAFSRILIEHIRRSVSSGGQVMLLRSWGGTQFLEQEARDLFPEYRVARLDRDTLASAEDISADILVSTMGVTRNFDFSSLKLVALMQADALLARQDFRADERAIQLLAQFRRRCSGGLFLIQTSQASHPVYRLISRSADGLPVDWLLRERQDFSYPPFGRMVDVLVGDTNSSRLSLLSDGLTTALVEAGHSVVGVFDQSAFGGGSPVRCIRLLLPRDKHLQERKNAIREVVRSFEKSRSYVGHVHFDVDPV